MSSAFFLAFAAVQLPLGMALDRFGPRRCLVVCAGIAIVGAILFASATSPGGLIVARALLGVGASASLVAPLSVYAWRFPPERFATLAGLQVGLGTIGTLIATAPLAFSTAAIGWRGSFLVVAAVTAVIGIVVAVTVRDDGEAAPHGRRETLGESVFGLLEVLRALDRTSVHHEHGGLLVVRVDRRPVGRALPDPRLWLRSRRARLPADPGAGANHRLAALGSDGPPGGQSQAAGAGRRGRDRRGAGLPRDCRHRDAAGCAGCLPPSGSCAPSGWC